jgi:hypothetical protein
MKNLRILVLVLACAFGVGATTGPASIIGIWRAVKSENSDPASKQPTGDMEMQFTTNGIVTIKMREPANGDGTTQTMQGKFTLSAPDRITFILNGTTQERYRYVFVGTRLRMEHLDFPVTNTLERIDKFSL